MKTTTYAAATQQIVKAMKGEEVQKIAQEGYAGALPEGAESLDENRLRRLVQYECHRRAQLAACDTIRADALAGDTLIPESD